MSEYENITGCKCMGRILKSFQYLLLEIHGKSMYNDIERLARTISRTHYSGFSNRR